MEENTSPDISKEHGVLWIALVVFGLLALAAYFYKSNYAVHDLLRALGFFLVVPKAYLHPLVFSKPYGVRRFKVRRPSTPTDWLANLLALSGVVLFFAGLIVEFWHEL